MAKLLGHDIVTTAELEDAKAEIARVHTADNDALDADIEALEQRSHKQNTISLILSVIAIVASFGAVILSLYH